MTTEFLHAAWEARLKPAQKLVLLHIANNQSMPDKAVPLDVAKCADFSGIPSWRVIHTLKGLQALGLIRYSESQDRILVVLA